MMLGIKYLLFGGEWEWMNNLGWSGMQNISLHPIGFCNTILSILSSWVNSCTLLCKLWGKSRAGVVVDLNIWMRRQHVGGFRFQGTIPKCQQSTQHRAVAEWPSRNCDWRKWPQLQTLLQFLAFGWMSCASQQFQKLKYALLAALFCSKYSWRGSWEPDKNRRQVE